MTKRSIFVCLGLCLTLLQAAVAAPNLRLTIPGSLRLQNGETRPIWIPSGTNGPAELSLEAWNAGDGSLNLSVNGGNADWLTPTIQGTQPCTTNTSLTCTIVRVLFDTADLPDGTYHGEVVVEDPNAFDAPQRVPIKIYVGGNVPDEINLYLRPAEGSSEWYQFETPEGPAPTVGVQAGNYLSVSSSGLGSFKFLHTHRVTATYRPGMSVGVSSGTITLGGSTFAADNGTIPVNVTVTDDPIVQSSASALEIVTVDGTEPAVQAVVLSNRGNGTLAVNDVEVETDSDEEWFTVAASEAIQASGGGPAQSGGSPVYLVTASQEGLEPGLYTGTIRFLTNAANSPTEVDVALEVQAPQGPELSYRGVVNGATFSQTVPLARGTLVSLFGNQLALSVDQAAETPLPTELANTSVMIGGIEAPLFFVSWGQINFQVPNEVPLGSTTVQVMRDGQTGNQITATVSDRSPGLFRLNPVLTGEYGAITNASQNNFPIPSDLATSVGVNGGPARPGDVITIYATGLGEVSPAVNTGAAAPSQEPLARGVVVPTVNFGRPFPVRQTPSFVGLAPGFVGLFQINVAVPMDAPTNARTPVNVEYPGFGPSNTVEIAVER